MGCIHVLFWSDVRVYARELSVFTSIFNNNRMITLWCIMQTQIGILVPIEPQRRTNGTSGTGSSIKHLKAVPFKTKKAPKRGNFHSPMWTYLIRTIDYILAPTKHLENFITIVFLRGNNDSSLINREVNVCQIAQWVAGWNSASIVYGSSLVDSILFFIDVLHWIKYFMSHRYLAKKIEIRFIIGDIRVILMMTLDDSGDITQMVLYNIITYIRCE